jgi:hypothetical protein
VSNERISMPSPPALFASPTRRGQAPSRRRARDAVDSYAILIEVRTPAGYAECYLAGAVHLDLHLTRRPIVTD